MGVRLEDGHLLPARAPLTPYGAQALGTLRALRLSGDKDVPSLLAVPLRYKQRRFLLEAIAGVQARPWGEEEERLVRDVLEQFALALEHAELFQQTQRSLQEVQRLYEATAAVNQAATYEDVLHALREHTFLREKALYLAIQWFDPPLSSESFPRWVRYLAQWRARPDVPMSPAARTVFPEAWRQYLGTYLHAPEVLTFYVQEAETPDFLRQMALSLGARKVLLAPFILGNVVHGWLMAAFDHDVMVDDAERRTLEGLMFQASARLSTLHLAEQTAQALEETRLLYQAASAVAEANTFEDLLSTLRRFSFLEHSPFQWAAFYLFEPTLHEDVQPEYIYRGALLGGVAHGELPEQIPFIQWTEHGEHPFRPGFLLVAEDLETEVGMYPPFQALAENTGTRAFLAAALAVGREVLGLMLAGFSAPILPDEEALRQFQTLLSHVAVRVQGLRLTEELQRLLRTTEHLYRASAALNQARTLEEVLHVLAEHTILGEQSQAVVFVRLDPALGEGVEEARGYVESALNLPKVLPQPCLLTSRDIHWLRDRFLRIGAMELDALSGTALGDYLERLLQQNDLHVRYLLLYPLWIRRDVLGVILGLYEKPVLLTEAAAQTLSALQAQVAVRVDGLLHYARAQELAEQLRTVAEIARDVGAALSVENILDRAVDLIKERFGFYHVSVFLLDAQGLYAVVRASTGPVGEIMKRSEHRLAVGSYSVVGQAALRASPVVVNDTDVSDIHRPNPLLPNTRAEAAIPLRIGARVVGVLDVQSTRKYTFTSSLIQVLQLLADQLAVAVESARAYDLSRRALEELRRADEMKSQFLANMSHELRTPLNSIIGFSRIILKGIDGPINDQQRQDLEAIYNAGQHLLGLINDILDLSKIEAGKMELAFEEVDMHQILESALTTIRGLIKDKPVELHVDVPDALPPLYADAKRLRQVLLNVLSNAVKFTEQGYIRVAAQVEPGEGQDSLHIVVEDTGPGIPKEALDKLFEPFYQVDSSITRAAGGTGLGLAITRHLVELHGGRIWIESEVGKGTQVHILLPVGVPESRELAFLVVFDGPDTVGYYQQHFGAKGYRILGTLEPKEFQSRVLTLRPFATIVNPYLSDRRGLQLLHQLSATPETRRTPKLLATYLPKEQRMFFLPFVNTITKPLHRDDVGFLLDWADVVWKKRHIRCLVVERDTAHADHVRMMSTQEVRGVAVDVVANFTEAFERLAQATYDAVLIDMLASGDILALLERLEAFGREQGALIPVIGLLDQVLSTEAWGLLDLAFRQWWQVFAREGTAVLQDMERYLYYLDMVHRARKAEAEEGEKA